MYVIKRDGTKTPIRYDKITDRNIEFAQDLNVDVTKLSKAVIAGLKEGMNTSDIDTLSAETAFYMSTYEPDFDKLAVRIAVSNLHKSTKNSFSDSVSDLFNATNQKTGKSLNIINAEFYNFVVKNKDFLDSLIQHTRDYKFTYFGFKTLCRSYLLKVGNKIIERPQYMWLRVATSIHMSKTDEESLNKIEETYNMMSQFYFTHASPTLFNAGSNLQQMSSCFLLTADDDLRHIYTTCLRSALISKHAGGIGIDITRVRSKGSTIHTTNGTSDGIVPMIKVFNSTSQYCNQCFVPETIIYLKSGIKQIKDVQIGDEVITIDGTYKPVVNVIKNNVNKEIMNIRTTYSFEPVKVTKEHQVYVLRNQTKRLNYDNILNRLEKEYIKPEYIDAHDLNELDLFGFPLCKLSETDDYEKLGNDFFRFYGIMLGDGHICKNRLESGVTLNTQTKQPVINFITDYLTKRNVHYWTTEKENTFYIRWTNHKDVTGLDYKLLYNEESEKRVHSSFLNLTYSHSINLIKGLLETDGSNLKEIYYTTTSYELAHNIRYILYKLGILSSGHITDNIGETRETKEGYIITSTKIRYDIRIPKHPILEEILDIKEKGVYMKYFIHDGIMWSRIKKIDREQYEGDVYDLSILNNNNYLVGSLGIVHNSGKRKGSIAMYLEPWHADVLDFLQLRFNLPPDEIRARDIFIAMWINDLFMKRVEKDEMWSLFCPNTVPQLSETYGDEFESIYLQAESQGKYVKQIKAQEVWKAILHSQTETGLPYMCYKDSVNKKSNQKNIGIVRSSNLCTEITEVTDNDSIAVCNLSSISLPAFVNTEKRNFDYKKLGEIVEIITENLNKIIDINFYPVDEAKSNNLSYRPIGIGIQGLSDVFAMLDYYWGDEGSKKVNRLVMEVIYYHALKRSCQLSKQYGPYSKFEGSPASQGILQYHMWGVIPLSSDPKCEIVLDWDSLIKDIKQYGLRNSLLIAPMPTASTSQIMGNCECLTGDTNITLTNGLSVKIKDFNKDLDVLSFDKDTNRIISKKKIKLLKQGIKNVIEITFQDGSTIKSTKDHMFLTDEGWLEAKDILGKSIISGYKGVLDEILDDEKDYIIELNNTILRMDTDRNKILALARLIGYLTGDGHIDKDNKCICLYVGNKQDTTMILNDIALFTSKVPSLVKNTRGLTINIPKELKDIILEFNLVKGRKATQPYNHPEFILSNNCPLSVIREYLAGHFGADGISPSLCKPKNHTSFITTTGLSHEVNKENIESLMIFMEKIQELLLKFDIKTHIKGPYKSSTERKNDKDSFYSIILKTTPTSKFGERIGFRYCWSKMIRSFIATSYFKYRENVLEMRKEIAFLINTSKLSVKKSILNINKTYEKPIFHGGMLTEHYRKNKEIVNNLAHFRGYSALQYLELTNSINFFENPYFISNEENHISLPICKFKVIHIQEIKNPEEVYDISINDTHNFIANSVIVHNCFEMINSNIFSRSTLAGDFTIVNKHLYSDLTREKLWSKDIVDQILASDGSIQSISIIPKHIRDKYKTVWELSQRLAIDYAAERGPFIDQSQSLNLYLDYPTPAKLTSMHFYGWKKGLKTGSYYIHSKPARSAVKFTISNDVVKQQSSKNNKFVCVGEEGCISCSG